jgi:hypothetical protein
MELMNKNETAKYLRISVGGVNRRLARGELIATKIGGLVFSVKKLSTSLSETVSAATPTSSATPGESQDSKLRKLTT